MLDVPVKTPQEHADDLAQLMRDTAVANARAAKLSDTQYADLMAFMHEAIAAAYRKMLKSE